MQAEVYQIDGKALRKEEMPKVFGLTFREDLVRRALLAEQSLRYQPQGHYIFAGMETSAVYVGAYATYRTGRHMGIAIRPRQKLASGVQGQVRRIPSSRKGRRAHQHKVQKTIKEMMNLGEYIKALESAVAGTAHSDALHKRHKITSMKFPVVVEDKIESISKTKDLMLLISNLKLGSDVERSHAPRVEKGRRKGQSRHFRKTVLFVAKNAKSLEHAGRNIPGVDVCSVDKLSVEALAPGGLPRLTVWSEGAVKSLEKSIKSRYLV